MADDYDYIKVPDKPKDGKFWKANEFGDHTEGEYFGSREGKYGMEHIIIKPDGNEQYLGRYANLDEALAFVKKGQYITIDFVGSKEVGQKSPKKIFKVGIKKNYTPKPGLNPDPDKIDLGPIEPEDLLTKALTDMNKAPKQWSKEQLMVILGKYYPAQEDSQKAFIKLWNEGFICEKKPGLWSVT